MAAAFSTSRSSRIAAMVATPGGAGERVTARGEPARELVLLQPRA